jgi:hypothetical protein
MDPGRQRRVAAPILRHPLEPLINSLRVVDGLRRAGHFEFGPMSSSEAIAIGYWGATRAFASSRSPSRETRSKYRPFATTARIRCV